MAKQPQLSPEKYITTKARTLPIDKCYITADWEEMQIANVVVRRRHVNGKFTVGLYLVDLLCLGIKDTFYMFNVSEEELEERIDVELMNLEEADYNLVHNVIYAGHDFALEFDIKPHKNFNITKFILEEDEKVPLIEIHVGDENGNPHLIVDSSYNYGPVLQKLKQHAGEGNYTFTLRDDFDEDEDFDDDDFDEDDDFDDGDEFDEDDDEFDEDDEDDDGLFLDFPEVRDMETEELEEIMEQQTYSPTARFIVNAELLLRELNETEYGAIEEFETIKEKKDYQLYDKKKEQWQKAHEDNQDKFEDIFAVVRSLGLNQEDLNHEETMSAFLELLEKYKSNDMVSFMIVHSIPLLTILEKFDLLEKNFTDYTPAVQLFIATYAVLRKKEPDTKYDFIINAATVEMAYPFNKMIHAMHHKLFWLAKAIHAIQNDDKEKVLYYHNLLRISGTGGHIKFLYAPMLANRLKQYLGREVEEDEDGNNDSYLDFEEE